ncbi:MAG: DUF3105 domain-containing protein [Chloroflexota bacterium]|nr:DUF3105 domain-containing protein [Chloroflexota bacterium]
MSDVPLEASSGQVPGSDESVAANSREGANNRRRTWRPARAASVTLVGQLKDSAFADPQFLVQRDGKYVQLSELLYRVMELADGTRTLGQIATRVNASTEWEVGADQVAELIEKRLQPLGLISPGDASSPDATIAQAPRDAPSPVTLKLRAKVLGPRVIDPITSVLQFLYWRPALLVLLLAVAGAHLWLYLTGGVVNSVVALIYSPALMSLVIPIVLLAAIFHEFGHAAALRYGGGHVRGMGVGLYVIYPVLYTDVTDSYRLGRGARLRTGLGGIYFHLLFALAVIAIFALTPNPVLAAAVLIINLEAIRQLLPLLRLDGYWILADLTGIPDPLTHLMAYLKHRAAALTGKPTPVPALRSWVRRVFLVYAVVTPIVMVTLLGLLVTRLPWLLGHIGNSLAIQAENLLTAGRAGDVPGALTALVGALFLMLPLVGLAYLFWTLGRAAVPPLWRLSGRNRVLRGALIAVPVVLVGAAAVVWLMPALSPQQPLSGVQVHGIASRQHVDGRVSYEQSPPVGGDHAPVWQNCGFYSAPVPNERAVHSLEHGAVWITYDPQLPRVQVDVLRSLAAEHAYALVSPYDRLPAPVVASAWGRQLPLESATDPRLGRFISEFAGGAQAPEAGGPCVGGVGTPEP